MILLLSEITNTRSYEIGVVNSPDLWVIAAGMVKDAMIFHYSIILEYDFIAVNEIIV